MKKLFDLVVQLIGKIIQKEPSAAKSIAKVLSESMAAGELSLTLSEQAYIIAMNELGVAEVPGDGNSPRVLEYHKATGLQATEDEVPWCSAFANWCIQKAGGGGTKSAMARSWLRWGKAIEQPQAGDMVIFSRGSDGYSGHVAFYVKKIDDKTIQVLGGNQMDMVCVANYGTDRVLGYRRSLDG
jgi:uncharacterized protein (TIGR02594 family)